MQARHETTVMTDAVRLNPALMPNQLGELGKGSPCTTTWIDTSFGMVVATIVRSDDGRAEQVFLRGTGFGGESGAAIEALGRLITIVLRIPSTMSSEDRMREIVASLRDSDVDRFTSDLSVTSAD